MTTERIKSILLFACLGVILLLWLCRGCSHKPDQYVRNNKIQTDLKTDKELKDSVRIRDSVAIHWKDKYRADKTNPLKLPCDTFLKVVIADCDTVIIVDSLEIEALKRVVKQDSIVIVDYQQQANTDSVLITKLERKVKRNRTLAKVAFIVGLGSGGFVGFKVAK